MPGVVSEADRHEARRQWLSTSQAGELMGNVTAEHVRSLIGAGALRALDVSKPGAKVREFRIRPEWVDEWIERNTVGAKATA